MPSMTRTVVCTSAASLLLMGVTAAVATAAPAKPYECDNPGKTWYVVDNGASSIKLTHLKGYQAPPGGTLRLAKTAEVTKTYTAGITTSYSGSFSAKAIFAKAESTFGVSLAASGSRTSTQTETVEFTLAPSKVDREYAVWVANRVWTGDWLQERCSADRSTIERVARGRLKSFEVSLEGVALCPKTRYKSTSAPYKACAAAWG